jgi:hypothetical protein
VGGFGQLTIWRRADKISAATISAEISYFAQLLGIPYEDAAALLGIPYRGMAEGGKGEPVVVGEEGPEVFIPDQEGTVVPYDMPPPPPDVPAIVQRYSPGGWTFNPDSLPLDNIEPRAAAWDRWLAEIPESANVEDLRSPEEKDEDQERWTFTGRFKPKVLVQFPPAPEVPLWLQAQEAAYLKSK